MPTTDGHVTLIETLDVKIANGVERALRERGIDVRRSRVVLAEPTDPRLRQQGTRLDVRVAEEVVAREVADALMMRRAHLLSFPRARRPAGLSDGGSGDIGYLGGFDGGCDGGGGGDGGDSDCGGG